MDFDALSASFSALPDPVKVALGYTVKAMIGDLKALPTLLLRRGTIGVEAQAVARVEAAKELGKLTAADAMREPDYAAAAASILLPTEIRRARNKAAVAAASIEEAAAKSVGADPQSAAAPDEDWMSAFMRHSEDASSEQMRALFGKILAGEIVKPGSFSRSTMRVASELDQQMAEDFLWFWTHSIGYEVPKHVIAGPGGDWARMTRLRDAGLVSPVDSGMWQPTQQTAPDQAYVWSIGNERFSLRLVSDRHSQAFVNVFNPTEVGRQLREIIEPVDIRDNLRALAKMFSDDRFHQIMLLEVGKLPELLWQRR